MYILITLFVVFFFLVPVVFSVLFIVLVVRIIKKPRSPQTLTVAPMVTASTSGQPTYQERGGGFAASANIFTSWHSTAPFVKFTVYSDQLVITMLFAEVIMPKAEITNIHRFDQIELGIKIEHTDSSSQPAVVFYPSNVANTLFVLSSAGYPVQA